MKLKTLSKRLALDLVNTLQNTNCEKKYAASWHCSDVKNEQSWCFARKKLLKLRRLRRLGRNFFDIYRFAFEEKGFVLSRENWNMCPVCINEKDGTKRIPIQLPKPSMSFLLEDANDNDWGTIAFFRAANDPPHVVSLRLTSYSYRCKQYVHDFKCVKTIRFNVLGGSSCPYDRNLIYDALPVEKNPLIVGDLTSIAAFSREQHGIRGMAMKQAERTRLISMGKPISRQRFISKFAPSFFDSKMITIVGCILFIQDMNFSFNQERGK